MSRPTLFDEQVAARVLRAVRCGNFRQVAATWGGVSPRTLRAWLAEGKRRPKSRFGKFRSELLEAERAAEVDAVSVVYNGGKKDPELMLRFLAIRWRKRWNPKQAVELTGKDGAPLRAQVEVKENAQSPERIAAILGVLERAGIVTPDGEARGAGETDDPAADEVHPARTAPATGGVPSP